MKILSVLTEAFGRAATINDLTPVHSHVVKKAYRAGDDWSESATDREIEIAEELIALGIMNDDYTLTDGMKNKVEWLIKHGSYDRRKARQRAQQTRDKDEEAVRRFRASAHEDDVEAFDDNNIEVDPRVLS